MIRKLLLLLLIGTSCSTQLAFLDAARFDEMRSEPIYLMYWSSDLLEGGCGGTGQLHLSITQLKIDANDRKIMIEGQAFDKDSGQPLPILEIIVGKLDGQRITVHSKFAGDEGGSFNFTTDIPKDNSLFFAASSYWLEEYTGQRIFAGFSE